MHKKDRAKWHAMLGRKGVGAFFVYIYITLPEVSVGKQGGEEPDLGVERSRGRARNSSSSSRSNGLCAQRMCVFCSCSLGRSRFWHNSASFATSANCDYVSPKQSTRLTICCHYGRYLFTANHKVLLSIFLQKKIRTYFETLGFSDPSFIIGFRTFTVFAATHNIKHCRIYVKG